MNKSFSKSGYHSFITALKSASYDFRKFEPNPKPTGAIYLRHDVDFSLAASVEIGQIEADLGVCSTYFVLASSPFYNLLDEATANHIRTLRDQGHEVGLHFDATVCDVNAMADRVNLEKSLLASITGECRYISFHRPAHELMGGQDEIQGMLSTYGSRYFNDLAYISDSTGKWRFGHPTEQVAFQQKLSMQILTHPIWWYKDTEDAPKVRLKEFIEDCRASVVSSVSANTTVDFS